MPDALCLGHERLEMSKDSVRVLFRANFARTSSPVLYRGASELQRIVRAEPFDKFEPVAGKPTFVCKRYSLGRKHKRPRLASNHSVIPRGPLVSISAFGKYIVTSILLL